MLNAVLTAFPDDNPDSWFGLLTSVFAGAAAAIAAAILLSLYFRSGYRAPRDVLRHGVGMLVALGLLSFAVADVRNTALGYLGILTSNPAVEFEIRLPDAVASRVDTAATQIELHTDRNQAPAQLRDGPSFTSTGESILQGSVPLKFRTAQRVVILTLPGHPPLAFRLQLAAIPVHSKAFGPWHRADVARAPAARLPDDAYAIRYRVI